MNLSGLNNRGNNHQGVIPGLNGIRALAVSLVFFAHSGLEQWIPGGLGVTVFFVLSGFLITTLLRMEHKRGDGIAYRDFYLRRLLRLMPPLLIVVALAAALAGAGIIDGQFSPGGLMAALFYVGNYFVIAQDFNGMPAGLGLIWSLAIEEHYYLFFPPLAAVLLGLGRAKVSILTLSTLCVAVLGWRYWLVYHGASDAYLGMATDTRVDAILIGCLLALVYNPYLDKVASTNNRQVWVLGSLCVAVLLATLLYRDEIFRFTLRYSLQSLAIAGLIFLAVARAEYWPLRWLNARPLAYIGGISYTVYLVHHMVLLGLVKHWPQLNWWSLTLLGAALTLVLAEPMRRWVEQPCAQWRKRLRHGRKITAHTASTLPGTAP